jgi:hypothetical protein
MFGCPEGQKAARFDRIVRAISLCNAKYSPRFTFAADRNPSSKLERNVPGCFDEGHRDDNPLKVALQNSAKSLLMLADPEK